MHLGLPKCWDYMRERARLANGKHFKEFCIFYLFSATPFWVPLSSLPLFPWVLVEDHVCLLDCIVVDLQDMDIFAAERHPREYSKAPEDSSGDLIFPSYFVRQTGGSLLTEPCRLKLQVERNLDK